MHTHRDAKAMAKILKIECDAKGLSLSNSESLEIVAKQFGLKNWNVLAAMLEAPKQSDLLNIPTGWTIGGSAPHLYDMGLEKDGSGSVVIRRRLDREPTINSVFGTLMQRISASDYIGKTIAFSGDLKALDVIGSATLWLRIDDRHGKFLEFSNMESRAIEGSIKATQDWVRRRIALDVPQNASTINFGFYLCGLGTAWARNFELCLTQDDPQNDSYELPKQPQNLALMVN